MSPLRFEAFALPNAESFGPLSALSAEVGEPEIDYVAPKLTGESVLRLADTLAAAAGALRERPVAEIANALGRVGIRFGTEGDSLRERALEYLPASAGISREMARAVLDGMAHDWTPERLNRLLETEFGDPGVLDDMRPKGKRTVMAVGPRLCAQIVSGSVPGVTVTALIRSLLVKGPTLVKPGLGDVVLPVLFAQALREEDSALADALAVVYWAGGGVPWEAELVSMADVVVAYGADATISEVRSMTTATTRFIGYHHRMAVAIVSRDALTTDGLPRVALEVANAVAMFDQRGCVCPSLVFVEEGGARGPAAFAEAIADALAATESVLPAGRLDDAEAARLHQFRGNAELRAAGGEGRLFHGGDAAPWTVTFESGPAPGPGCLGRTVRVRSLPDASALAEELEGAGSHLQTIGATGFGERLPALAVEWGRLGASRIVPVRDMSFPPPWWYHDGRGPLQDLVRWVEVMNEG